MFSFTLFYKLWSKETRKKSCWLERTGCTPDLKIKSVIAKIDTGANLATIDADDIKFVTRKDVKYVKFTVKKETTLLEKLPLHLQDLKNKKLQWRC